MGNNKKNRAKARKAGKQATQEHIANVEKALLFTPAALLEDDDGLAEEDWRMTLPATANTSSQQQGEQQSGQEENGMTIKFVYHTDKTLPRAWKVRRQASIEVVYAV